MSMQRYLPNFVSNFKLDLVKYIILIVLFSLSGVLGANTTDNLISAGVDPHKYEEGKKVFMTHCSRCHGTKADGRGRMAPLYRRMQGKRPSNFTVRFYQIRPIEYLKAVVRDGGSAHHLSELMPSFASELDETTLDHVVYFVQSVSKVKFPQHKVNKQSAASWELIHTGYGPNEAIGRID
jgi:mono/diheme cytochrome c family protein